MEQRRNERIKGSDILWSESGKVTGASPFMATIGMSFDRLGNERERLQTEW